MKKYLFLLVFSLFFLPFKAQWLIGAKSGLTFGLIRTSPIKEAPINGFIFNQTWPGATIALTGEYRFLKKMAFQMGISWIQKNYHIIRRPFVAYYINDFWEFPFQLKFFFLEKKPMKFFLSLGGYIGYWAWAYEKGNAKAIIKSDQNHYHKYSQVYEIDPKKDVRSDLGILGALGTEYQFGNHHLFLENQFSYGFIDTEKKYPLKPFRGYMALIFYLGYFYEF